MDWGWWGVFPAHIRGVSIRSGYCSVFANAEVRLGWWVLGKSLTKLKSTYMRHEIVLSWVKSKPDATNVG